MIVYRRYAKKTSQSLQPGDAVLSVAVEHIHHGLWSADETASVAQQKLTDSAREAVIKRSEKVLDAGCGMGSSSIYLVGAA